MKKLQNQLRSIAAALAEMEKKFKAVSQKLKKVKTTGTQTQKPKAVKAKSVRKTSAEKAATPVLESVYALIRKSRKGLTVSQLSEAAGLTSKQVSNSLYKLTKQGKIQSKSRGLYIKK